MNLCPVQKLCQWWWRCPPWHALKGVYKFQAKRGAELTRPRLRWPPSPGAVLWPLPTSASLFHYVLVGVDWMAIRPPPRAPLAAPLWELVTASKQNRPPTPAPYSISCIYLFSCPVMEFFSGLGCCYLVCNRSYISAGISIFAAWLSFLS